MWNEDSGCLFFPSSSAKASHKIQPVMPAKCHHPAVFKMKTHLPASIKVYANTLISLFFWLSYYPSTAFTEDHFLGLSECGSYSVARKLENSRTVIRIWKVILEGIVCFITLQDFWIWHKEKTTVVNIASFLELPRVQHEEGLGMYMYVYLHIYRSHSMTWFAVSRAGISWWS